MPRKHSFSGWVGERGGWGSGVLHQAGTRDRVPQFTANLARTLNCSTVPCAEEPVVMLVRLSDRLSHI